jgi:hypothetical protein
MGCEAFARETTGFPQALQNAASSGLGPPQ